MKVSAYWIIHKQNTNLKRSCDTLNLIKHESMNEQSFLHIYIFIYMHIQTFMSYVTHIKYQTTTRFQYTAHKHYNNLIKKILSHFIDFSMQSALFFLPVLITL